MRSTLNALKEHFEFKSQGNQFAHPLRFIIEKFRELFYRNYEKELKYECEIECHNSDYSQSPEFDRLCKINGTTEEAKAFNEQDSRPRYKKSPQKTPEDWEALVRKATGEVTEFIEIIYFALIKFYEIRIRATNINKDLLINFVTYYVMREEVYFILYTLTASARVNEILTL